MKAHAWSDANSVLQLDKKCRDFFRKGRTLEEALNVLQGFGESAAIDLTDRYTAIAGTTNSGQGSAARLTLYLPFFADGGGTRAGAAAGYHWSSTSNRYEELFTGLYPRQYRALTMLHEFAHALGIIPSDRATIDKSGTQSAANDALINEKCGKGLNNLPDP
jgi:hypothetical protein